LKSGVLPITPRAGYFSNHFLNFEFIMRVATFLQSLSTGTAYFEVTPPKCAAHKNNLELYA